MDIRPTGPKLDNFDAKEMRELAGSRAWGRIKLRLESELERHRATCERSEGNELHRAQGAAAAVRVALGLPEQLLAEITKSLK